MSDRIETEFHEQRTATPKDKCEEKEMIVTMRRTRKRREEKEKKEGRRRKNIQERTRPNGHENKRMKLDERKPK